MADNRFYGTGRRKNAIARVWLAPGSGNITVNKRGLSEYFGKKTLEMIVEQPLALTSNLGKYDVMATVKGGGTTGQAGAVRHGIAKALVEADENLRKALKAAGFLRPERQASSQRDNSCQVKVYNPLWLYKKSVWHYAGRIFYS